MKYYLTTTILGCLYYFGYFPASCIFWLFCKLHGCEGGKFWDNVRINPLTIITSVFIWAIIGVLVLTAIAAVR